MTSNPEAGNATTSEPGSLEQPTAAGLPLPPPAEPKAKSRRRGPRLFGEATSEPSSSESLPADGSADESPKDSATAGRRRRRLAGGAAAHKRTRRGRMSMALLHRLNRNRFVVALGLGMAVLQVVDVIVEYIAQRERIAEKPLRDDTPAAAVSPPP